ncbi:KAP family P-loop NTPase fold protein [Kaistia defluvii]|uniref:KAP NTPase domain-containing protein n=1 Tax=Kaistia defluvii TaxID=410841 RepID=A0ABV2QWI1_9HYPH
MRWDEYSLGDDQPKQNPWREDKLGYAPFARRLADVIINMAAPNGFVIGIHGKWGSGKTTAINFVLSHIDKHNQEIEGNSRKVECIEFRPWIVSGQHDLIAAFFKILSENLGPSEGRLKRSIRSRVRFLYRARDPLIDAAATLAIAADPSFGAVTGIAGGLAKTSLPQLLSRYLEEPSLQKAYQDLREQLLASGRKFVVTIDDIDRLDNDEIRSVMQMVKTIGRLPNVIYILSYDRDIVSVAIDADVKEPSPRFTEKIVQQEVALPQPSRGALLGILDREISFLLKRIEGSTRWHSLLSNGVHRWVRSPRDVLRLANALKFSWPALREEFDGADLVAIEGIRLFEPRMFDWIRTNRDFFFNEGEFFIANDEQRKSHVRNIRELLSDNSSSASLELLATLFPLHAKWFLENSYSIGETNISVQNRRGLASEAGYDGYFALHPSADAIPKAVLDDIIANFDSEAEASRVLKSYLNKINSLGKPMIGLLLRDLRLRLNENNPVKVLGFLKALVSIGDDVFRIPWSGEMLSVEPNLTLQFLVTDILAALNKNDVERTLLELFSSAGSVLTLSAIYVLRGRELGVFPTDSPREAIIDQDTFDALGSILLKKILKAKQDDSLGNYPIFWPIIVSWKHLGDIDDIRYWIQQGVERSGTFTANLLLGMVYRSSSQEGVEYTFKAAENTDVINLSFLHNKIKMHLAEKKTLTPDQIILLNAAVRDMEKLGFTN